MGRGSTRLNGYSTTCVVIQSDLSSLLAEERGDHSCNLHQPIEYGFAVYLSGTARIPEPKFDGLVVASSDQMQTYRTYEVIAPRTHLGFGDKSILVVEHT